MTQPLIEDVLEIIETFQVAARQLRRLGRGPLRNGNDFISSTEFYLYNGKIRFARTYPHDVCFETANKLEQFAASLQWSVRGEPLQS
jgi:hypothetical protein